MNGCPSKMKGDVAEAMIAARLMQKGLAVLKPFGDNLRYDLAVDDGQRILRVQCKYATYKDGSVKFSTCSGRDKRTYYGQADLFGVYCESLDSVYIVPVKECKATREKTLRVLPSKNGQKAGVVDASVYKI